MRSLKLNNYIRKHRATFLALIALVVLLASAFLFLKKDQKFPEKRTAVYFPEKTYVPSQMVVKYRKGHSADDKEILALDRQVGVVEKKKIFSTDNQFLSNYYLLSLKPGSDVIKIENLYLQNNFIEAVQPNFLIQLNDVSVDDQYYSQQWALSKLQMSKAWELGKGSKNITVAVIDSGIDYNHEDLPKDILRGPDLVGSTATPMDTHGHGTHIAGVIGALTNNGTGISGINWEVTLMAVKTVGSTGKGTAIGFAQGMEYAVNNGAKVVNLSFGADQPCSSAQLAQDAVNYATEKGAIVVAAAGNSSKDSSGVWPASCKGAITVAATTPQDTRASFSNFGSKVDISAPGTQILSTKSKICSAQVCPVSKVVGGEYLSISGTSMATPMVTGVIALLLSRNPELTPSQIKSCIVQGGDVISTDQPIGPRINAYKAMQVCDTGVPASELPTEIPTVEPTSTPIPTPTSVPTKAPTPTLISKTPTIPLLPTSAPAAAGIKPTAAKTPTPVPIPYSCTVSASCRSNQSIQMCFLICTKK